MMEDNKIEDKEKNENTSIKANPSENNLMEEKEDEREKERIKKLEKEKRREEFFNTHKEFLKYKDKDKIYKKSFKEKDKEREKRRHLKNRDEIYQKVKNMSFEEKDKYLFKYYKDKLSLKKRNREQFKLSYDSNFKICFDLSYDEFMSEREIKSLSIQLSYCYSLNKKNKNKISYYFTNISNKLRNILNQRHAERWSVHYYDKPFYLVEELINLNKEFVYLSPNAEEELEDVNENQIYIIGGLVDRTIDTNRSLSRVEYIQKNEINKNDEIKIEENKINDDTHNSIKLITRKLPLKKYLNNLKNTVLNINTVVEILSCYMDMEKDQKNWKKAIETAIPKRKLNI